MTKGVIWPIRISPMAPATSWPWPEPMASSSFRPRRRPTPQDSSRPCTGGEPRVLPDSRGHCRKIRPRIDVGKCRFILKAHARRTQHLQQPPCGRMSAALQRCGDLRQCADGPQRAQRLITRGSLGHGGSAARCRAKPYEKIIRQQRHIAGTDGKRGSAKISCPDEPDLDAGQRPQGITRHVIQQVAVHRREQWPRPAVPGRTLAATTEQVRCSRRAAQISKGVPASSAAAFSPPKRTERPPARTMPTMAVTSELASKLNHASFEYTPACAAAAYCAAGRNLRSEGKMTHSRTVTRVLAVLGLGTFVSMASAAETPGADLCGGQPAGRGD